MRMEKYSSYLDNDASSAGIQHEVEQKHTVEYWIVLLPTTMSLHNKHVRAHKNSHNLSPTYKALRLAVVLFVT